GGEDGGQAHRRAGAQRLAVATGILGCDPASLAGDSRRHRSAFPDQRFEPLVSHAASQRLLSREVAEAYEKVVSIVHVAWKSLREQTLQLELDRGDRIGIQQLAQILT